MKDKAIQGLSQASTKNKLAKDAQVADRNKKNVGRRNNYNSSLSSVSTSSASPFFGTKKSNVSSLLTTKGNNKNLEAKRRLQQKRQAQALKVAEKIPVLNKYAKMAKMAQQLQNSKKNKGGFFKNMFGGFNSNQAKTPEETSEINSSSETENEQSGIYSVTIKQSTLKKIGIGIALGGFISLIFICIIMISSITDSGGQSYLASNDNPTEEELGEAYQANEDGEGNESNSEDDTDSDGNDNTDDSSSNNSSSGDNTSNSNISSIVYVGDSRMVGMCASVSLSSKEDCSTAKGSMGYNWFSSTALPSIKSKLNANKNSSIVICMGTNDLLNSGAPASYAKDYNQLAKDYKDSNIIVVSVTEIDDSKAASNGYQVKNSQVVTFNQSLKSALSSDVKYCDVYSKIENNFSTSDGIHYTSSTYKNIYQQIQNCL